MPAVHSPLAVPQVTALSGMTVLVTGGAGFIGSSLCRVLTSSGARVIAYDNLATGTVANLDLDDEPDLASAAERLQFLHGDVRDAEKLRRTLAGVDVVYHLACLGVRHSIHSPFENHHVNATGTLTLLEESHRAGVGRVVHVSSSEVYGTAVTVPMSESHTTDPHTVYGGSKLAGECYARAFHRCYDYETVVIRPFNAYGPRSHHEGDSGEVIPRFLVRALNDEPLVVFGDGTQTRDLTHVYDTAAAIARAGIAPNVVGMTINVGSDDEISVNRLAELILEVTGSTAGLEHIEPRPGDVLRLFADSRRAAEVLDHRPAVSLREGIADLAERLGALGSEELARRAKNIHIRNWQ